MSWPGETGLEILEFRKIVHMVPRARRGAPGQERKDGGGHSGGLVSSIAQEIYKVGLQFLYLIGRQHR